MNSLLENNVQMELMTEESQEPKNKNHEILDTFSKKKERKGGGVLPLGQ